MANTTKEMTAQELANVIKNTHATLREKIRKGK